MYVFDSISHSWKERGRGELHLNDSHQSTSPIPQSRIGMYVFCDYMILLHNYINYISDEMLWDIQSTTEHSRMASNDV